MSDKQLVGNLSSGYNYKYASLADIAKQGFKIPKMKIQTHTANEFMTDYVYYYDEDLKEWIQGARVVIPEMKSGNKAQMYGAAVTYARRFTTLMALGLATDDDVQIEEAREDKQEVKNNVSTKLASDKQIWRLQNKANPKDLESELNRLHKSIDELTIIEASQLIEAICYE